MRKFLFILLTMVFTLANAETIPAFPAFPMLVWGELKIDSQSAPPGTVLDFYDSAGIRLYHYVTTRAGVYGGNNSSGDLSATLNQFSGNLAINVTTPKGVFSVLESGFLNTPPGEGCPVAPYINFVSKSCRYDISLSTTSSSISGLSKFTDISNSFARDNIIVFEKKGLIKGFSDNTFRPNAPITRAEFLAIAFNSSVRVIDKTVTVSHYTDIPGEGMWMIPYIEAGRALGISGQVINGKSVFRPNAPITRAEALAMLFKVRNIAVGTAASTSFADVSIKWQIPYVATSSGLGIISGQVINGKSVFRPNAPITRAESVAIIAKALLLK